MFKNKPLQFYQTLLIRLGVAFILIGNVFAGAIFHTNSTTVVAASKTLPFIGTLFFIGALAIYFINKKATEKS